jgi:hypothetical protein
VTDWPLRRQTLSASALGKFAICPEQFRREYVLGQWGPGNPNTVLGNALHSAMERAYTQRIQEGSYPDEATIREAYHHAFDKEVDEEDVDWGDKSRGGLQKKGEALTLAYYDQIAKRIEPVATEIDVRCEVVGVPVPITGRIDLLTPTAKIDTKTGKQAATKPKESWLIQARVYLLADPRPMHWHTLNYAAKNGPIIKTPETDPGLALAGDAKTIAATRELIRRLAAGIRTYYDTFGPDDTWPSGAIAHTWACSFCHHKPTCPYWQGGPSFADLLEAA